MIVSLKKEAKALHIAAPPSKSIYHRELIIRFLLGNTMHLEASGGDSDDVLATKAVLSAMDRALLSSDSQDVILPCNESGSTLRFMIPVAAAFLLGSGRKASGVKRLCFTTKGRLFDRPLDELEAALTPHGISIEKDSETRTIIVSGEMYPGTYTIDGGVSSQYISGLIMALTLFREKCEINVTGDIKSIHYIELTEDVLKKYGCAPEKSGNKYYPINNGYRTADGELLIDPNAPFTVEGDWSNGAFLLCLKEFTDIEISNLNYESRQGDKAILDFLDRVHTIQSKIKNKPTDDCNGYIPDYSDIPDAYTLDCTDIPDITPYMAVVAAFTFEKAVFTGISRLRIKESDRVMAVREQLEAVGIKTEETEDSLTVYGNVALPSSYKKDSSANVNPLKLSSYHDHRMAMCAILISVILDAPVELDDVQCLNKSFPQLLEYLNISD